MKTTLAILMLGITHFAQAQDSSATEKVYGEFAVPDAPPLTAPRKFPAYVKNLPVVEPTKPMTAFRRALVFRWSAPTSESMTTLLKQIEAAEKAGDTETYDSLTAAYRAWADASLLKGASRPAIKD